MFEIGYKLCSEEQTPDELIHYAHRAEGAGFDFAMISDHFHPWVDKQGQSSFVWTVLGGIAMVTERLKIGTAVTCPTVRIHPAIIAQAATAMVLIVKRLVAMFMAALQVRSVGRWPDFRRSAVAARAH